MIYTGRPPSLSRRARYGRCPSNRLRPPSERAGSGHCSDPTGALARRATRSASGRCASSEAGGRSVYTGVRRLTTFRRAARGFCPGQTVDRARRIGPQTRQTIPPPPQPRDRPLARRRPGPRAYDSANYPAAKGISVGHASKGGRTRPVRRVWSMTPQGAEGFSGSRRASGRLGEPRCGRRSGRAARRLSGRQAGMSRWFVPAPHRATGTGRVE